MNTQNRLVPLDDLLALVEGHSIHHSLTSTQRSEDIALFSIFVLLVIMVC